MPGSLTVRCAGRNFADRSLAWNNRRYLTYRRYPSGSILPFLGEIASIPGSPCLRIRPGIPCARRCRGNLAAGIRTQGIRCAESWRTVPIMPAAGQLRANPRQTHHQTFAAARRDAMMPRRICGRDRPGVSTGALRPAPCARGDPGFRHPAAAKKRRPAKATNPSREMFKVSTDICPHPGAVARGSLARVPGNSRESRPRVQPAWDRI